MMRQPSKPLFERNPSLAYGSLLLVGVFIVAFIVLYALAPLVDSSEPAAQAGESTDSGQQTTPGGPVNVTVVAKNLAFDKRTITASPGADVTVTLDNQDAGVLHNIAFYTNRNASTKIAAGDLVQGPGKLVENFKAPTAAGNYFFRCDAHPDQMTGSFVVK